MDPPRCLGPMWPPLGEIAPPSRMAGGARPTRLDTFHVRRCVHDPRRWVDDGGSAGRVCPCKTIDWVCHLRSRPSVPPCVAASPSSRERPLCGAKKLIVSSPTRPGAVARASEQHVGSRWPLGM